MKTNRLILCTLTALSLTACGSVSDQLGLNKKPIDEFQITTRAPLVVPPDFDLRPPQPGVARPQEQGQRSQAAKNLIGLDVQDPEDMTNISQENLSEGELSFLTHSGGLTADPTIRARLDEDARKIVEEPEKEGGWLENYNPFLDEDDGIESDVIDPVKEKERLESLKEESEEAPETNGSTDLPLSDES